jgi:hypothetical protein
MLGNEIPCAGIELGKKDASSTGHGRSGTAVPRNSRAAVKLRKTIRPVVKTDLFC